MEACKDIYDRFVLEALKNDEHDGRIFSFIPKLMWIVDSQNKDVDMDEDSGGNARKGTQRMMAQILQLHWPERLLQPLLNSLRDVPMQPEDLKRVVHKLLEKFPQLELDQLPTMTYEMLLLATKGQKQEVMRGLIRFFSSLEGRMKADGCVWSVQSHEFDRLWAVAI